MGKHVVHGALGAAGLLGLLLVWWLGVHLFGEADGLSARFSPQATLNSLVELLGQTEVYEHVWVSLKRILIGLLLALLIGVPLGLLVGSYRHLEAATTPAFQFLRMISPLSWMPVVVMLMGVGDQPIYFLLAFAALWPILLNTAAGVRQLDPRWLQLSRSLSATRWETLCKVIIPGVLGHVLTGVRLAIGILWIVLVPCEMLGVSAGLGYFILDTRDRLAYSELMAMVLLIGVLGYMLDALARGLHRRWVHALPRERSIVKAHQPWYIAMDLISREPWWREPPKPGQREQDLHWGYLEIYKDGHAVFVDQRPSDRELAERKSCRNFPKAED